MFKTILGSAQVNSVENTEINKQSHVKFWLNWIKYGAVSYSLSCNQWFVILLQSQYILDARRYGQCFEYLVLITLICVGVVALLSLVIYTITLIGGIKKVQTSFSFFFIGRKYNANVCYFWSKPDLTQKNWRIPTKPKLLSAEVKNSRVVMWIVLPLLAKALYEFGFFEGIL